MAWFLPIAPKLNVSALELLYIENEILEGKIQGIKNAIFLNEEYLEDTFKSKPDYHKYFL